MSIDKKASRSGLIIPIVAALLLGGATVALAGNSLQQIESIRHGSTGSSSVASTSQTATEATSATSQAAQTATMAANAQASLQHSLQVWQAAQAAQSAARTTAQSNPGSVPNGLVTGGLVPDSGLASPGVANPVTTWVNAKTPVQTTSNGETTVTVTQTGQQALLNWQTFNIGATTTLDFDQSAGGANAANWVAINKVAPSIAPSEILGSMKAQGQVYVIDQNGIVFGGASQVNVGALVASSLPINSNLVTQGLLNDPDDQFLFSQLTIPVLSSGSMSAYTPPAAPTGGDGDVVVEAGAQLTSPSNGDGVGGKIALIGPNVTNAGTISTPNGQTILAAGNQVGFAAHDANDPTLRGLDVYVGSVDSTSGTAENNGIINSTEGDVTIAGKTVNQNGVINSSTSVSYNGRVDLEADYDSKVTVAVATQTSVITPTATGTVNFGTDSLTQILPELSSTDTVVGTQLALSSIVNVQGQTINLDTGALLYAPSAALPSNTSQPALGVAGSTLTAGLTLNAGSWAPSGNSFTFANTNGSVTLGQNATIDVSGSENVAASVAEDIVAAQLLGTELADSPLQQNGPLRGKTIDVNLLDIGLSAGGTPWIGTPLADVSGYINLVQHNVGELTTAGGSVAINAGGSVNVQTGSTVNVSGGWINYQGATVQTTKVVSADGQTVDISQADPDQDYTGIYGSVSLTSQKWNTSESLSDPLVSGSQYEPGFIQGGNGGSLTITAPSMTLNGNFFGNTVAGANQRAVASQLSATYSGADFLPTVLATQAIPTAGSLTLNFQGQNGNLSGAPVYSPTPPAIDFGTSRAAGDLVLSPDLVNSDGFGNLTISNGDGSIYVPSNVSLTTSAGGSIAFTAANLDIEGSLSAPDGNLSFNVYDYSPYAETESPVTGAPLETTPPVDPARGLFFLGSNASLSTAGLIVDDLPSSATADTLPLAINGGTITIKSFGIDFALGSTLNVSGGADASAANKVSYGNGGRLSIIAGQDPGIPSLVGNTFTLDSTLIGYSGAAGGSLTIQAPLVQVGGVSSDPASALTLSSAFFTQGVTGSGLSEGGFASFTFDGLGEVASGQSNPSIYLPAVDIAPGVTITPLVQSLEADVNGSSITLDAITQPFASLRTPANVNFDAEGVLGFTGNVAVRGDLIFGAGSVIETDPKGGVSLSGQTVDVQGSIIAPGGTISISGATNSDPLFANAPDAALVTVDIGPDSVLSAAGTTLLTENAQGYRTGSVLAGGKISVSGNILAEAGSELNVSGATDVLDVLPTQTGAVNSKLSTAYVPTRVDSSGGSITLSGGQELFSAATLEGAAGGPSAQGGSLTVKSGLYVPVADINNPTTPLQTNLEVVQSVPSYNASGVGNAVTVGGSTLGTGYFAADSFNSSGLDALTLGGTVQFSGPVQIAANRSIAVGSSGIIYADANVTLTAPYVDLGQAFQGPLTITEQQLPVFTDSAGNAIDAPATYGSGSLTVNAGSLIDVGNLSLQDIGNLNLTATGGDIRGDGTLDVSGAIGLTAGQIYPTTETTFTIAAFDHNGIAGSVNIADSGTRQLPLSAGGTLNVFASDITQGGVLRAPIGTINLGSGVTSASPVDPLSGQTFDSAQQVTLTSGSVTSVSAVDPVTGDNLTIPYGTILDGVSWIDPAGNDITAAGNGANAIPAKAINISAGDVIDQSGATIDLRGGGDLYGYRFVSGTSGTVDILASKTSYAVIPGYSANYAPYYSSPSSSASPSDYTNGSLAVGEQVYLEGGSGLSAGVYTLLPAGYALLPGAYLVTPQSATPPGSAVRQLDGSSVVGGYVFNGLDADQTSQPLLTSFAVASQAVVRSRAEYDNFSANTFLSESAASNSVATPLLPIDAGQLVLAATQGMTIQGNVLSQAPSGGLGSEVDIASPSNIVIDDSATLALPGTLVLDASDLTAFGADSLLIGGYRTDGTSGMQVTVTTPNITVDNAGEALTGPDVILAANQSLTVAANAEIEATGSSSSAAQALVFGNASVAGSGDGVLLRVSSDASAQVSRAGVDSSAVPSLTVDAGATLSGNSLVLDSTAGASIDPAASLSGTAVSIGAGQISLVLDNSQPTSGFVLSGNALSNLQASAKSLSLLSYSSIDIYGSGVIGAPATSSGSYQVNSLELDASEIRGFDGGSVTIDAQNFALDNGTGINAPTLAGVPAADSLTVNAATIQLGGGSGVNTVSLQGYANVSLNGSSAVMLQATPSNATDSSGNAIEGASTLGVSGNLQIATPEITGATGANQTIQSAGTLTVVSAPNPSSSVTSGGLGATLNLAGTVVTEDSSIILPSGNIGLDATNGDVVVGGTLNVSGSAQTYHGLTEYTPGGTITLTSDNGSVDLNAGSTVSVAAPAAGGNAGTLSVSASNGTFNFNGVTLAAQGGAVGTTGSFVADLETISGGSLDSLDSALDAAGFTNSISIRDRTDTNVSLDGTVSVGNYSLSLDSGSITVNGTINASNVAASDSLGNPILVGGTINLNASGSITLATGSVLTVAGQNFNNAGKGGSVSLDAGSEINGNIDPNAVVDIASGSTINLSVGANTSASAAAGDFTGTLQIRAPQTSDNLDLQVDPINGTIVGASSITAEGYELYSLNNSSGSLIDSVEGNIYANGTTFAGNAAAITSRLLANNAGLAPVFNVVVGAEVINPGGDLTLDNDWDLSTFRFGPNNTPGVLTLRAAGNLIFDGSLSDGFTASSDTGAATGGAYNATLMSANATLPANLQSWTYNLTAGADFSAANVSAVVPNPETYDSTTGLAVPGTAAGSLELGNFVTSNSGNAIAPGDDIADAMSELSSYYQVIRTGTGNINIATGGDVLLQNQFASIYTSGAQVADPTMGGTFSVPVLQISDTAYYPAQYSLAGGNVTISAQGNIAHVTENNSGTIVMDSEKELPNNWLYRRGYLDSAGQFGATANGDTASTSWWVDFSNFFEGVGTLGGGNVTLSAGHDVSNVDAVAPTNARMSYTTASGDLNAADQTLTELGGGNVGVTAGNDINGGVYYVERGQGTLQAGNSIITNSTRSASLGTIALPAKTTNSKTWLPTTLFLGAGSFDVTAQNSVLLGPAANPFLLPQGVDNTYWDKTYFSTYAASDEVNVASLSGDVTLREDATTSSANSATPLLYNWLQTVDLLTANPQSVSYYEPWLNITETNVTPFETVTSLLPPTLDVTAFSGDINDVGNLTLSPSATGTVSLVAEGSINGLQPTGVSNTLTGVASEAWSSSTIDLSDADPAAIPGVFDPYAYELVVGTTPAAAKTTGGSIEVNGTRVPVSLNLTFINDLFAESGSTEGNYGVLQTKLDLHADINGAPLHANDPNPVYIYAGNGDISGLTLFSPKPARVVAGQDITDIALYIQNVNSNDISLVSAGRDIIAYDASAPLLVNAQANGNALDAGNGPLAGDIQIAGPGTIEVMAGRNLNLGVGPNNADGTGVGLTSIGNQANPVLPFAGADIVALAGVGDSAGLNTSNLVFTNSTQTGFIDLFLDPTTGGTEAQRYLPDLGGLMGLTNATDDQIWAAFSQLSTEKQDDLALDVFYLVLRDAGRDHNDDASAPGALTYAAGFAAINALFPSSTTWQGDISLTSREIKTENGGDISLLAPGGALNVGLNVAGTQPVDQGILTEDGGNINIFTNGDVNVGTSRIFTLNGGNEVIWSSYGGIDAGASSKTVQSAPPTRVLVDPQSGAVQTDLAGLATGGGIGVLETRATTGAADVDLIAPHGDVNAGDAGIRASGNLNIAAVQVLNASNIMVGGKASGVPTASVSNVGALVAGASVAGALNNAANEMTTPTQNQQLTEQDVERPSIITVEVLGYGGSDDE
jgi:filamentous hemagglutinin family protein